MKSIVILFGCLIAIVVGSQIVAPVSIFRYRQTIEFDTPSGIKSGSNVVEVEIPLGTGSGPGETRKIIPRVRGEAIFVDLGNGKNIVALLAQGAKAEFDNLAFLPSYLLKGSWNTQHLLKGSAPIPIGAIIIRGYENWPKQVFPTLVTFTDLKNPASAHVVEPAQVEQVFGAGYRLRRATIEMVSPGIWPLNVFGITGTPMTHGIEASMPWVGNYEQETKAWRSLLAGSVVGPAGMPDLLFKRH